MALWRSEEDDGEVTSRRGGHGRQQDVVHGADGPFNHCLATAQRSVDVQTTKVFSDRLQFLDLKGKTKKY